MKFKIEKSMQIVNDLMMYCYTLGAVNFHLDLKPGNEVCTFELKAEIPDLDPEVLEELILALGQHRTMEIEELYWGISYDSDSPCETIMIGMMLDEATAEYHEQILTITGRRKN